ncbi:MAG: ABC transporter permease [Omnitrophica WOR_2 bacterium]
MQKMLYVFWHELISTIQRRSYIFATFGIPLISSLILSAVSLLNRQEPNAINRVLEAGSPSSSTLEVRGYVDLSGLVQTIPPDVPPESLKAFSNMSAAQTALQAGEISAYYIVPKDYLQSGEVILVKPDFNPLAVIDQSDLMQWVMDVNLLNGDTLLASRIQNPLNLQVTVLNPASQRDQENPLTFFLPYAVTMIYYFIILMTSSLLLNSVTKEKENRVIEILMMSVTPRQLLAGKIVALGLAGLLQTSLWVGTGYLMLRLSGSTFNLPAEFQLPPSFLVWALIFFLLGYLLYASLMAAVGALVPNLREASQATFIVILPLLVPLMGIGVLITAPDGGLAVALSLIPFTAPVAMMTRLAAGGVPFWQLLLAAALLAATAGLVMRTVAGMFRAQTLLTGQPFSLKRLLGALAGRSA